MKIFTHQYDSSGFNCYVGSRTYCDSYVWTRQSWCVVHTIVSHRDLLAAHLKALYSGSLIGGKNFRPGKWVLEANFGPSDISGVTTRRQRWPLAALCPL
jgi:hypothetical protein